MATWLNDYQVRKEQMAPLAAKGELSLMQSMEYQELLYRIEVLETCQMFCKTAPVTTDLKVLIGQWMPMCSVSAGNAVSACQPMRSSAHTGKRHPRCWRRL